MKYFFDRNIAKKLTRMRAVLADEHIIVHQDDDLRFEPTSTDVFIINALANENPRPVFLTADLNMLSKYPLERKALSGSGLTVVFFRKTFHHLPVLDQAMKLLKAWPDIVKATCQCRTPTAFEVNANAKIVGIGLTAKL